MMNVILWPIVQGQNAWAQLRDDPNVWGRFKDEERGQGLVEYALIIALIALAVIAALIVLGDEISRLFGRASEELSKQPQ